MLPAQYSHQGDFQSRKLDAAGDQVYGMLLENTGVSLHFVISGAGFHQVADGKFQLIRLVDAVQDGQAGREIVGSCAFGNVTLLVGDSDDFTGTHSSNSFARNFR